MNTLFLVLFLGCVTAALGQSVNTADVRSAYPWERYKSTVERNPFTQKTLPVVPTTVQPFQDWALASIYGDKTKPTVALVNLKTGQRLKLTSALTSQEGFKLHQVVFGPSRHETYVEVSLGEQRQQLKWDTQALQRLVATRSAQHGATASAPTLATVTPHLAEQATSSSAASQSQLGSSASPVLAVQRSASQLNPMLLAMGAAGGGATTSGSVPSSGTQPGQGQSAPSSEYVNVPLEGSWAQPARRALLRPTLFAGHPDPQ